jgi:D-apionolactonase
MATVPSRSVRLFGTHQSVDPPVLLKSGALSAELEAGNLRYIRWNGRELLRAVSFVVRDRNWGTYNPAITDLKVTGTADAFKVTYDAVAKDTTQEFHYRAEIAGSANGRLVFRANGRAETDFVTNRTGFVILHPIDGVAGQPARVEHVDGEVVETSFPDLIDPVQPMMNLRAITHQAGPGVSVTCRMEGDTFEMEDQRNWMDASYKTYVRPLALPWPYTFAAGSELEQTITVTVEARGATTAVAEAGPWLAIGAKAGVILPLGFGLEPELVEATLAAADVLRSAGPHHVLVHYNAARGHGRLDLEAGIQVAIRVGAEPWLEFVVTSVTDFENEIERTGKLNAELGSPFTTVVVSPASDLKSTLPGSVWPPSPPLDAVYRAVRAAFPSARIGGGMFSYFTELNRKRPPVELLDLVSFTNCGMVHAGDDRSATEGLEALPYITRSAAAIADGKPWHAGPSALAMRDNPYGEAPMANPDNIRQAMNRMDPRQRGLLGAVWYLGYFAHMSRAGAAAVTLGGGIGPFGIVHAKLDYAQPYFDEAGGLYPAFHVFKGLAALAGSDALTVESGPIREIQAIAAETDRGRELWVANLTGEPKTVALAPPVGEGRIFVLDVDSFPDATRNVDAAEQLSAPYSGDVLALGPYAVARIVGR